MEIVSIINENQNHIFKDLNLPFNVDIIDGGIKVFTKTDPDHNNSYTNKVVNLITDKVSFNLNPFLVNDRKIDMIAEGIKLIRQEVERFLIKNLIKQFTPCDYILIPTSKYNLESERSEIFIRELVIKSHHLQTKNIIVSSLIGSELSFSLNFNSSVNSGVYFQPNLGGVYKTGTLCGLNLYIDPYLKYDDNRIFLWDDVDCYLSFGSVVESISPLSFGPTGKATSVVFNYHLEVKNPSMIHYLGDKNSPGYDLYISDMRDRKIDQILDGK